MTGGVSAVPDPDSVARLLRTFREFAPKVRTPARRELRAVGDDVIAAQREILDGPLPEGVAKVGQTRALAYSRRQQKFYTIKRNVYGVATVKRPGRSTGLREGIKAGLKTRVVASAARQSIEVKTTGPKVDGFNTARFWNLERFRHPVFGRGFVYQAGQPFFYGPARAGRDEMLRRAQGILERAAAQL